MVAKADAQTQPHRTVPLHPSLLLLRPAQMADAEMALVELPATPKVLMAAVARLMGESLNQKSGYIALFIFADTVVALMTIASQQMAARMAALGQH
jgi:hypothetical protein